MLPVDEDRIISTRLLPSFLGSSKKLLILGEKSANLDFDLSTL